MIDSLNLFYAKDSADIQTFWKRRDEYLLNDVMPNCELGDKLTQEDLVWFFSKEYKGHTMMLSERSVDPLYIVFINKGTVNIGFITYVIYTSEDGKCFILDYCIY